MKLISQEGGKRVYLGADDKTWYEVRMEIVWEDSFVDEDPEEMDPDARQRLEAHTVKRLRQRVDHLRRTIGMQPTEDIQTWWDTYLDEWWEGKTEWDEEAQEWVPVPEHEPITQHRFCAGMAVWPPAPVDPDGEEPPAPTASEIRRMKL